MFYTCPVCFGRGFVQSGFYTTTSADSYSSGGTEECRSCKGSGVLFREKKEEKEIKKKNFYHKEQRTGSFYRSVSLPNYANVSRPKATYEKGVLKILFPKTESAQGYFSVF